MYQTTGRHILAGCILHTHFCDHKISLSIPVQRSFHTRASQQLRRCGPRARKHVTTGAICPWGSLQQQLPVMGPARRPQASYSGPQSTGRGRSSTRKLWARVANGVSPSTASPYRPVTYRALILEQTGRKHCLAYERYRVRNRRSAIITSFSKNFSCPPCKIWDNTSN
jgi:hypothetical protein